jgi:hypothetical protein
MPRVTSLAAPGLCSELPVAYLSLFAQKQVQQRAIVTSTSAVLLDSFTLSLADIRPSAVFNVTKTFTWTSGNFTCATGGLVWLSGAVTGAFPASTTGNIALNCLCCRWRLAECARS